jgi:type I restriction enzyme S subunit
MVHMVDIFKATYISDTEGMHHVPISVDQAEKFLLRDGDLLFARRSIAIDGSGKCVLVGKIRSPATFESSLIRVTVDKKQAYPRFYYHYFSSREGRKLIMGITRSVTISGIAGSDLESLIISVPPIEEQRRIADILDIWDSGIRLIESAIYQSRMRRTGLMQQLLAGKRRLTGFKQPWRRIEIGQVLAEVDRPIAMRDDAVYRLASVSRNWDGLFEREALYGRDIKTKNLREIKAGDFLISHIQAAYGALALVPPSFDGFKVSNMYSCLRSRDPAQFDLRFFAYLAQQPRMTYLCRSSSNGFFAERLRLNFMPEVFLQQTIDIPPTIEEQRRIIDVLEGADREIVVLEKLAAVYREQKKGLMQQLLTGKRRVKVQAA